MSAWIWSPENARYYRWITDSSGAQTYEWAPAAEQAAAAQPTTQAYATNYAPVETVPGTNALPANAQATYGQHDRSDSVVGTDFPPPVPYEERIYLQNFIAGTPEAGWYDSLDTSYCMRTGSEARQFFKKGRVFATLYTEPTGGTARPNRFNPAYTTVKFGASVYTQIRRFVVVSVRNNFVYAVAIATYGKQGTLKPGCRPGEHAVIYNTGVDPERCYLSGEKFQGLYKEPIEVRPADQSAYLTPESRIRFGKAYAIEWNVKVKDIGMVISQHVPRLLAYYEDENHEVA